MDIGLGYPEAMEFWFADKKLLMVKLNSNAFVSSTYSTERTYVGHCNQGTFEGL